MYSDQYWGEVSALRQGQPLQNARIAAASRAPCTQHKFDLFITEFASNGEKLTSLTLLNVPKKPGVSVRFKVDYQSLYCGTDTIGSTFTATTEELPWGIYKPLNGVATWLSIESFDSLSGDIKGTFSITMIPDKRKKTTGPDTFQIKNGRFATKLKGSNGLYKQ
ncbi:hypothetical protein GCM10027190_61980 [Spirosoma areae]